MAGAEEKLIEGTLSILWTNFNERQSAPRYDILFSRYEGFRGGAQRPYAIVGTDALKNYLVGIGFEAENTNNWIKRFSEKRSVAIPNVMLSEKQIAPYTLEQPVTGN